MAWQGAQRLWKWGRYSSFEGDINIISTSHVGDQLNITGEVKLIYRNPTGYTDNYYHYTVTAYPQGGNKAVYDTWSNKGDGYSQVRPFSATINVGANETSASYSVQYSSNSGASATATVYWTIHFNASSASPSGLTITDIKHAALYVQTKVSIDSYGVPSNRPGRYIAAVICRPEATSVTAPYRIRKYEEYVWYRGTINDENSEDVGGFGPMLGMLDYKVGMIADNLGAPQATKLLDKVYHNNPAAGAIDYTHISNSGIYTVTYQTEAEANDPRYNKSEYKVYIEIRIDNGAWEKHEFTPAAGDLVTYDVHTHYGQIIEARAYQTYYGNQSLVSKLSFQDTDSIPPSNGGIFFKSMEWNKVKLKVTADDYGEPANADGRYLRAIVGAPDRKNFEGPYLYEDAFSSKNFTTTISNESKSKNGFKLLGMTPFRMGLEIDNTKTRHAAKGKTIRYTPPAPGKLNYTRDPDMMTCYVTYKPDPLNNLPEPMTAHITITAGDNVQNFEEKVTITDTVMKPVVVGEGESVKVEAYLTQDIPDAVASETSTITLTNSTDPVLLYGEVNEKTKLISPLYGPYEKKGEQKPTTKKIFRLYGEENGVTKLIYLDTVRETFKPKSLFTYYEVGPLFLDQLTEVGDTMILTVQDSKIPGDPEDLPEVCLALTVPEPVVGTKNLSIFFNGSREFKTTFTEADIVASEKLVGVRLLPIVIYDGNPPITEWR